MVHVALGYSEISAQTRVQLIKIMSSCLRPGLEKVLCFLREFVFPASFSFSGCLLYKLAYSPTTSLPCVAFPVLLKAETLGA